MDTFIPYMCSRNRKPVVQDQQAEAPGQAVAVEKAGAKAPVAALAKAPGVAGVAGEEVAAGAVEQPLCKKA